MATEIIKSFGVLQNELDQARSSLKGVDENIKRLIGRDPSELVPRPSIKRGPPYEEHRGRQRIATAVRNKTYNNETVEFPGNKTRNISVFKRLSDRVSHYDEEVNQLLQKQMISKVIVTAKEVPSRQEALAAQTTDEKSKARNRRMFGALLGTLQKFQQEETKLKVKGAKRAQVEKKIEEHEIKEKAEIKKERQELFFNRKKRQAEIKMIELKMTRMREHEAWEERQKPRMNFIQTKAKPHIHYSPRRLNDANKSLLENCKSKVEKMIEKKRKAFFNELQIIEDRMLKNFEVKKFKESKQDNYHIQSNDIKIVGESHDEEKSPTENPEVVANNSCHSEHAQQNETIIDPSTNVPEASGIISMIVTDMFDLDVEMAEPEVKTKLNFVVNEGDDDVSQQANEDTDVTLNDESKKSENADYLVM